jgi:hypothetical protein
MAFLRRILAFLGGERGPADIVVSADADAVRFRLPDRWYRREVTTPWLVAALVVGSIIILAALGKTLELPDQQRDLAGMRILIAAMLCAMAAVAYAWRIVWHFEVVLSRNALVVECTGRLFRRRRPPIDLAGVRQFTVVSHGATSLLQAEWTDDQPRVVLDGQPHAVLVRLAELLARERARLDPAASTETAVESALLGVRTERLRPPLSAKVSAVHHDSGVTLDFPLPDDARLVNRREAWHLFEIGLFLLMAAIIWFAACMAFGWRDQASFATLPFLGGLALLVAAARQSWAGWTDTTVDDDLRQLCVVDNLLIRTSRDHRKQVWLGQEIREIALLEKVGIVTRSTETGESTSVYDLDLALVLGDEAKVVLRSLRCDYPLPDYRLRAELEWIATLLRQALSTQPATPPAIGHEPVEQAIQDLNRRLPDTRVSPSPS